LKKINEEREKQHLSAGGLGEEKKKCCWLLLLLAAGERKKETKIGQTYSRPSFVFLSTGKRRRRRFLVGVIKEENGRATVPLPP
jgi:hypothetical protein